jgi:hypothetical protein
VYITSGISEKLPKMQVFRATQLYVQKENHQKGIRDSRQEARSKLNEIVDTGN